MPRQIVNMRLDTRGVRIEDLTRLIESRMVAQILQTSVEAVMLPEIRRIIRDQKMVYLGTLFSKISAETKFTSKRSVSEVEFGAIGVDYGMAVELGTKPHTAPFSVILDYVKRKMKPRNAHAYARRVWQTIQKRGTKPHPFVIPAWNRRQKALVDDYVTRLRFALRT